MTAPPAQDEIAAALAPFGRRPTGPPEPVEYSVRNQNYRVPTDGGPVFLRFHRRSRSMERLEREHRAIAWTADRGIPAVRPLRDVRGETLVQVGDRIVAAFPWVDGRSPRRRAVAVGQAAAMGEMLGRVHATLAGYADPTLPWIWGAFPTDHARALAELEGYRDAVDGAGLAPDERALVMTSLATQIERLRGEGAGPGPDPGAAGVQPVHGDYHERNVLVDGQDRIAAVVDWDMVTLMPRAFEVVRCLTYAGLLDRSRLEPFLAGYGERVALRSDETREAVAQWWRFNLMQGWLYRTRLLERDATVQQFFPEQVELLTRFGDPAFRAHLADELVRLTARTGVMRYRADPMDALVLVTPHGAVPPEQRARMLSAHPRARVELVDTAEALAARIGEADGVVSSFPLTGEMLARATRLRWVHSMAAGVERFLTPELRAATHVQLTASKGPMGQLMAEHALALLLALARNLPGFMADQRAHRWRRMMAERAHLVELGGKTILILGVGEVGGHLARMCGVGLGMRVLGTSRTRRDCPHVDRYVEPADLLSAFGEADVVSLSLPATDATRRIVDRAALAAMKPTAYLVNVARGQLVDEEALVEALREGRLAGAGLDAVAAEPLSPESPLWDLPNVIVTPHTSAVTDRLAEHFVDFWAENVRRFVEGEPLQGVVDRDAGY